MFLSNWMLQANRDFVIKHKGILELAIIAFAFILPEPTKENTLEPNSHVLIDRRDKFFSYYTNGSKMALFKAAWKIRICEYEHDPHYRSLDDWDVEEQVEAVLDGRWQPRPIGRPASFWDEPRTEEGDHGLYNGRRFKELIKKIE